MSSRIERVEVGAGCCAPAASAHAFCAVPHLRHLESFHDRVRVERMLLLGIERARRDAERYRVR